MSRSLAAALYAALCLASVAAWVSYKIEKACTWACPCDDGDAS